MGICHVSLGALHSDLWEPPGPAHTLTSQAAGSQDVVETTKQPRPLTLTVPFPQEVGGAQHAAGRAWQGARVGGTVYACCEKVAETGAQQRGESNEPQCDPEPRSIK